MKVSEIIKLLEQAQKEKGDVEVLLYGHYASTSDVFEIIDDGGEHYSKDIIHIWTDINTG